MPLFCVFMFLPVRLRTLNSPPVAMELSMRSITTRTQKASVGSDLVLSMYASICDKVKKGVCFPYFPSASRIIGRIASLDKALDHTLWAVLTKDSDTGSDDAAISTLEFQACAKSALFCFSPVFPCRYRGS